MSTLTSIPGRTGHALVALIALSILATACGSNPATPPSGTGAPAPSLSASAPQTESNPPGDIPDNQAYVAYQPTPPAFSVKVPEGWAKTTQAGGVTFTDKLNSVQITSSSSAAQPTEASVKTKVTSTEGAGTGFAFDKVSKAVRKNASGLVAIYRVDTAPNPVTGKVINDDVEQYVFWRNGTEVDLRLSGPHGADNVDPWRIVTDSFSWSK
jgi:hypothetical protein